MVDGGDVIVSTRLKMDTNSDYSGNDSRGVSDALHCVRLSGRCNAIRKDSNRLWMKST